MKNIAMVSVAFIALLLVAGCDSSGMQARVQEKAVVYNNLEPWQQRDIQNGIINVGNSTDMVYMALGRPSKIVTTADGLETTWTYNNYYPPTSVPRSQLSLDTTGRAGYSSAPTSTNGPAAPGGGGGFSSTRTRGTTPTSLDVGDVPSDTLYVIFRDGQVYQTQLESEKK